MPLIKSTSKHKGLTGLQSDMLEIVNGYTDTIISDIINKKDVIANTCIFHTIRLDLLKNPLMVTKHKLNTQKVQANTKVYQNTLTLLEHGFISVKTPEKTHCIINKKRIVTAIETTKNQEHKKALTDFLNDWESQRKYTPRKSV